ncbi:MAG: CNNM domain-containing protein [Candidatus Latescibacterota bacterium]
MIYIALILFCVLLSGFFSGSETGLFSCNRIRIRYLAEEGHWREKVVHRLLLSPERSLSLILVGNNMVNILAVSLATYLMIQWVGGIRAELISTLVMAPIVLIFGEVIPKVLFQQKADELTPWVAPPLKLLSLLLAPLVSVSVFLSAQVLKIAGVRSSDREAMLTRTELHTLIREARRAGAVDLHRGGMMEEVIDLRQTRVRDVMEPIEKVEKLSIDSSVSLAIERMTQTTQDGLLVFRKEPSDVVGVLFPRSLLDAAEDGLISDLVEPVHQVSEEEPVDRFMEELQQSRHSLSLVSDSAGHLVGLVTLEDLLEEIVGEMEEEA